MNIIEKIKMATTLPKLFFVRPIVTKHLIFSIMLILDEKILLDHMTRPMNGHWTDLEL